MVLIDRTELVAGVDVRLVMIRELMVVDGAASTVDRARVSAAHAGCGELEVEAQAGSYFFALGRQDAMTGHAGLDDRYIVKTNDEDALRYWLGDVEGDAVMTTYDPHALDPFALTVSPTEIVLEATFQPRDSLHQPVRPAGLSAREILADPRASGPHGVTRVDEAVTAVATLAGRGARLAARWRALLEPVGVVEAGPAWRTDDGYGLTLERGRHRIRVDFPWKLHPLRRRGLRTRVATAWPDAGVAVVWPRTWSWRSRPRLARGLELALPPPWYGEARDVAALTSLADLPSSLTAIGCDWLLVADGQLAVGWERIVEDRDRLAAATALLARWAERVAPTAGPYR